MMPNYLEEHREQISFRYQTFKMALTLLENHHGRRIVETGTIRQAEDWGAGCSTLIFAEYCEAHDARLVTVDNSPHHMEISKKLTADYAPWIEYVEADSIEYLKTLEPHSADLLYLDSFDYPYSELLNIYGGQKNIQQAMEILAELGDDEVFKRHTEIVLPCQLHCARELQTALHALHEDSIVLIDDANIPGGGKPRIARQLLHELGWTEVLKDQQTLWVK